MSIEAIVIVAAVWIAVIALILVLLAVQRNEYLRDLVREVLGAHGVSEDQIEAVIAGDARLQIGRGDR